MTIVEKAAYLKGLADGLGIEPQSKEGKLWNALSDLLSDIAHEIEDLHDADLDFADALDEMSEDLSYLEELTCDLDMPTPDFMDVDEDEDDDFNCTGDCLSCGNGCIPPQFLNAEDDEPDEEIPQDEIDFEEEVMYDVTCPTCGLEITVDEEQIAEGSIVCPGCGEKLVLEVEAD